MTYYKEQRLLWRAGPAVAAALLQLSPAAAQTTGSAGLASRILDFSFEPSWYALLVAFGAAAGGALSGWVWYRFALEGDLIADRGPASTRLAGLGLGIIVGATIFTMVAPMGVAWLLIATLIGLFIVAASRAFLLAIFAVIVVLSLIVARIYSLI